MKRQEKIAYVGEEGLNKDVGSLAVGQHNWRTDLWRQIDDSLDDISFARISGKAGRATDALDHAAKQMKVGEGGRVADVKQASGLVSEESVGVLENSLLILAAGRAGSRVVLEGLAVAGSSSRAT